MTGSSISESKRFIYVITTPLLERIGQYEVGVTDNMDDLMVCYRTVLADVKTVRSCQHPKADEIAQQILSEFEECKVINSRLSKLNPTRALSPSECLRIDRDTLTNRFDKLCRNSTGSCSIV